MFSPVDGQEAVFEDVSHVVQSAVDGYNVCIFAYGQTGSGKTWTMSGNGANPGVQPRSVQEIFSIVERDSDKIDFKVCGAVPRVLMIWQIAAYRRPKA